MMSRMANRFKILKFLINLNSINIIGMAKSVSEELRVNPAARKNKTVKYKSGGLSN
jgi:hypothetical protein